MEKKTEFDCPWCHVKIPLDNLKFKTRPVEIGGGKPYLVCIGCAGQYNIMVMRAMELRLAEQTAKETGMTVKQVLAMRQQAREMEEEDQRLIDEEVSVMDGGKIRKLFHKMGDMFEQRKSPLQVMREKFFEGLRKTSERKIIIPGSLSLKGGRP
jgi:hypothetical protein